MNIFGSKKKLGVIKINKMQIENASINFENECYKIAI